jgi:hypothetical protein
MLKEDKCPRHGFELGKCELCEREVKAIENQAIALWRKANAEIERNRIESRRIWNGQS